MVSWESVEIAIVLLLVAVVFFGFVRERLPPEIVALGAVGVLLALGVLDTDSVLQVFANKAPITVGAMFVLSAALERTGVIDAIGRLVQRFSYSPTLALGGMMLAVMALSAFINNTPVVIILAPVVISLARATGQAPTKLLIPLSYAAILGGTTTMIGTSTNIIVDGVARELGLAPFGMFEISGAGIIMAMAGAAFVVLTSRYLLPDRESEASLLPSPADRHFVADIRIPEGSTLIGRRVADAGFSDSRGLSVLALYAGDGSDVPSLADHVLQPGDRLMLLSKLGDMLSLRESPDVALGGQADTDLELVGAQETVTMEGIVGPRSPLIGRRVRDLSLARNYGVAVLAAHRHDPRLARPWADMRLRAGDTVLLEGPARGLRQLFDRREFVNLARPGGQALRRDRAPVAVLAVLAVMVLAAFEVLPIAGLAMLAATAVVAFRCVDASEAYAAVHWNVLMLIFAMLALSQAMQQTGAAKLVVEGAALLVAGFGPLFVLSAVYAITSLLTEFMSNNAAAILLTPIAAGLAQQMGVDPRPFVVAVMFAASASFATPIGYQTNTFVYSAGGYRFADFLRVGVPMNLLLWGVATFIIPIFWPLG